MENHEKLNIKQWAVEDRPREKLLQKGISALSDAELIAILIGSGNKNETAVELSKKILLKVHNNLNELGKLSIAELQKNKGIGEAKAISIVAALELGKRRKHAESIQKQFIQGSNDIFNLMHPLLCDLPHEEFWIILLNRSNKIIDFFKLSHGGIAASIVDIKLILKQAIEKLASGIILCHNHPSGNITPSSNDISITKKIKEAATFFEIKLLDHLIISENAYYSFTDEGVV